MWPCVQDASLEAAKLAEKVMLSCAGKIKPYVLEIVKSGGGSLSKYDEVIASICEENSDGLDNNEKPASGEVAVCF